MPRSNVLIAIAAMSLFACPGKAAGIRLGSDAVVSAPSRDLTDVAGSPGYGGSLQLEWLLVGGHALRPRLDFVKYPAKTVTTAVIRSSSSTTTTATYNVRSAGVGVDYLFYPAAKQDGWHLVVGLEAMRYSTDVRGTTTFGAITLSTTSFSGPNTSTTKLAYGLGAGYMFVERWNLEARFNSSEASGRTLDSYNVSIGYRW